MTALFPDLRSADGHAAPLAWHLADATPRCTSCGHRQPHPVTGALPGQTREQPPWRWPGELYRRRWARRQP